MSSITELWRNNAGYQVGNPAAFIRVATAAVADVQVYEAWLSSAKSSDPRARCKIDGSTLRRAVLLSRRGNSSADLKRLFGCGIAHWLALLPPELAP